MQHVMSRRTYFGGGTVSVDPRPAAVAVYGRHGGLAIFIDAAGALVEAHRARQDGPRCWAAPLTASELEYVRAALTVTWTGGARINGDGQPSGWRTMDPSESALMRSLLSDCPRRLRTAIVYALQGPARSLGRSAVDRLFGVHGPQL